MVAWLAFIGFAESGEVAEETLAARERFVSLVGASWKTVKVREDI